MSRCLTIAVLLAGLAFGQVDCLGPNLVPNPGFENADLDGWQVTGAASGGSVTIDGAVAVEGRQSLRLAIPADGASARVVSPVIPVEGGATYLVALSYRQEGFAPVQREQWSGVSSSPSVEWLAADGKRVGASIFLSRFVYGPTPWDLRDALETAPPDACSARLCVTASNGSVKQIGKLIPSTLWVDAVQLRRYTPLPTPAWARGPAERVVDGASESTPLLTWFAAGPPFRGQGGQWSRVVNDPRAERGTALEAVADSGKGLIAHGPYYPYLPAGLGIYRCQVRAAVPPDAGPVGHLDVAAERSGSRLLIPIGGRPDSADYTIYEGDFILRDNGWWCPRLGTLGETAWRVDFVRIIPLMSLTDRQLLDVFPASAADIPADLEPPPCRQILGGIPDPRNFNHTFVVGGFGFDRWRLPDAVKMLQRDSRCEVAWVHRGGRSSLVDGFPEDPAKLFANSAIVLVNVPMNAVPLGQKRAIFEFVKRGGALVILPGHQAYERGAWRGSLIEETMPVRSGAHVAGGLLDLGDGARLTATDDTADGLLDGLAADDPGWVRYVHRVELRPGARVFARAGAVPFAVGGDFGEGRVVCILGWPTGHLPADRPGFWTWRAWPHFLRDLTWWALKRPEQTDEDILTD